MALLVGGGLGLAGGVGAALVAGGVVPNPFSPKQPATWPSQVGTWPTTSAQAHADIIVYDAAWFEDWLQANKPQTQAQWTTAMTQLHLAGQLVRQAYPGAGPAGGYTCQSLVSLGALPSNFPCPAA